MMVPEPVTRTEPGAAQSVKSRVMPRVCTQSLPSCPADTALPARSLWLGWFLRMFHSSQPQRLQLGWDLKE